MKRLKLKDRALPSYTRGEELFHFISHTAGGGIALLGLVLLLVRAARHGSGAAVTASAIYGASLVLLYTMSALYHGLRPPTAKKVMQVLDHCTIFFLIGGTYTPVALCSIRSVSPGWGWSIFGVVWGFCLIACVFTAIDLHKYAALAMVCYIGMGWCILLAAKQAIEAIPLPGLLWLLAGGVAYTVGAVLYGVGKKKRWMHALFHLFVIAGSVLQYLCIFFYVI